MSDQANQPTKRRRRWSPYRLRTILAFAIVLTVIGMLSNTGALASLGGMILLAAVFVGPIIWQANGQRRAGITLIVVGSILTCAALVLVLETWHENYAREALSIVFMHIAVFLPGGSCLAAGLHALRRSRRERKTPLPDSDARSPSQTLR